MSCVHLLQPQMEGEKQYVVAMDKQKFKYGEKYRVFFFFFLTTDEGCGECSNPGNDNRNSVNWMQRITVNKLALLSPFILSERKAAPPATNNAP